MFELKTLFLLHKCGKIFAAVSLLWHAWKPLKYSKQHTCKDGREEVHEYSSPTRAGICFNTFFNLKHLWVPRKALVNSPIRASHLPLVCVTSYTQRISLYVTPPIMKTMILGPVFISVGPLFLCQLPYRALQDVTRENRNMYCSSEINVFFSTRRYLFIYLFMYLFIPLWTCTSTHTPGWSAGFGGGLSLGDVRVLLGVKFVLNGILRIKPIYVTMTDIRHALTVITNRALCPVFNLGVGKKKTLCRNLI